MRVRPVGANGDMVPIQNDSQMIVDGEAVAQIVKERLRFYRGEWWEDKESGFQLPEFIADTVRKSDVDILAKYITSYIAETEGVIGISGVRIGYDKRVLTYRCVIQTEFGNQIVEVDLSGVL